LSEEIRGTVQNGIQIANGSGIFQQRILPVVKGAPGGRLTGFVELMECVVEADKVYLIILFQIFDQTALDRGTNARQTRGNGNRNLGSMETMFQAFPLGLLVQILAIAQGKVLKGNHRDIHGLLLLRHGHWHRGERRRRRRRKRRRRRRRERGVHGGNSNLGPNGRNGRDKWCRGTARSVGLTCGRARRRRGCATLNGLVWK